MPRRNRRKAADWTTTIAAHSKEKLGLRGRGWTCEGQMTIGDVMPKVVWKYVDADTLAEIREEVLAGADAGMTEEELTDLAFGLANEREHAAA